MLLFECFSPAPAKLDVRASVFRFTRILNSDLWMAVPNVQVRTKRRLRCPDQPDPRPNPNPNPNPTLWGGRGLLSRSAGAVLSLRANLKTLHVRTIKRLVVFHTRVTGASPAITDVTIICE